MHRQVLELFCRRHPEVAAVIIEACLAPEDLRATAGLWINELELELRSAAAAAAGKEGSVGPKRFPFPMKPEDQLLLLSVVLQRYRTELGRELKAIVRQLEEQPELEQQSPELLEALTHARTAVKDALVNIEDVFDLPQVARYVVRPLAEELRATRKVG